MKPNQDLPDVSMWTDGSSILNPGKAAWGVFLTYGTKGRLVCGHIDLATNNQMEIEAVIQGFRLLTRSCRVFLFTDSQYVLTGLKKLEKGGLPDKNQEYWAQLPKLMKDHVVHAEWVKGHSGHPLNELVNRQTQLCARYQISQDQTYGDVTYLITPWELRLKVAK